MLRQKDIIKYKTKSKIDQILLLRKDAEYILKYDRPIKENIVHSLNDKKVQEFIEDILINKKISSLLFSTNSKYELKTYLNFKKKFFTPKNEDSKIKKEEGLTQKKRKEEEYLNMKNEITQFKKNRKNLRSSMDKINYKKIEKFKKEISLLKNTENRDLKNNKIKGFTRAYSTIKKKIDFNRGQNYGKHKNKSFILINNYYNSRNINRNSTKIKSLSDETTESGKSKNIKYYSKSIIYGSESRYRKINMNLPHVKLNIKDVFNRLYHNVVLLSPSSFVKKNKRPLSSDAYSKKRRNYSKNNIYKGNSPFSSTNSKAHKINFNLKKVIKSTSGKEFTLKITKDIIKKCFIKYSGGPTVLKLRKDLNKKEDEDNTNNDNNKININDELEKEMDISKKSEDFVNYYNLINKKTGNSFLHLAVIGGYDEFVRYFIEKKSDINLQNSDGNTPLHLALINKDKKIIDILMSNKPKLDIPNNKGEIQFDYFTPKMKEEYGIDKLLIVNKSKKK